MKIYPSLISCDLMNISSVIKDLDKSADGYHIDIMDDHFVPNLTWGPAFVNAIRKQTTLPLHIHLMVDNPMQWVDRLKLKAGDAFIPHAETLDLSSQVEQLSRTIRNHNLGFGLAINPETEVSHIAHCIDNLDEVLIMSVKPGFSGQQFINTTHKVAEVKKIVRSSKKPLVVSMDGGIDINTIHVLTKVGVNIACVASAIFLRQKMSPGIALHELKMLT